MPASAPGRARARGRHLSAAPRLRRPTAPRPWHSRLQQSRDLKDQQRQVEGNGQSFMKLAESAAAAATAIVSFTAIKSGVLNAQQLNSSLEVQARLMGQNSSALRTYAAASEAAGGSQQGFLGDFQGLFSKLAGQGLKLPDVKTALDHARQIINNYKTPEGRELAFQRLGISDPGLKSILTQSDADYKKSIADAEQHAKLTKEDADAAREFGKVWSQVTQSLSQAFTHLGTDIFPMIEPAMKQFSAFLDSLRNRKGGTEVFFTAAAAGATLFSAALLRLAASITGVSTAATGAAGVGFGGAILAALGLYDAYRGESEILSGASPAGRTSVIGKAAGYVSGKINSAIEGQRGPVAVQSYGSRKQNLKESFDFWLAQGKTPNQASALVAMEASEGQGDTRSIGDYDKKRGVYTAFGAAQWHLDRIKLIERNTGIDVRTASHADQLRAIAWELKHRGQNNIPDDPAMAEAYLTKYYEVPADIAGQSAKRAALAVQIANSYKASTSGSPLSAQNGGRTTHVKIDDVNIHTQATDANAISQAAATHLQKHITTAINNADDGNTD